MAAGLSVRDRRLTRLLRKVSFSSGTSVPARRRPPCRAGPAPWLFRAMAATWQRRFLKGPYGFGKRRLGRCAANTVAIAIARRLWHFLPIARCYTPAASTPPCWLGTFAIRVAALNKYTRPHENNIPHPGLGCFAP